MIITAKTRCQEGTILTKSYKNAIVHTIPMNKAVRIAILSSLLITFAVSGNNANAATPTCEPVFGGGEVDCRPTITKEPTKQPTATHAPSATPTLTPTKTPTPTLTPTPAPQTVTKGGLAVNPPAQATTTPKTGPEMFSLIGLLPAAGIGVWLRRKTKL